MDDKTLRKVQLTQLEIAKEFKRICDENNLKYIMEGGTLIGAVRHEGFIPWDDDMDFSMPREDYDRFFEIVKKNNNKKYEVIDWRDNNKYPHPFGKFVKKGTIYQEEKSEESFGIYIDIFPWDNMPTKLMEQRRNAFLMMSYRAIVRAKCGYITYRADGKFILKKWLKNFPFIILSSVGTKKWFVEKYERMAIQYNKKETSEITLQCETNVYSWKADKKLLDNLILLQFEDTEFCAPAIYDEYLTRSYGDYMTPPPENKRGNQHLIVKIDFGEE